jgi:hypothetical protein
MRVLTVFAHHGIGRCLTLPRRVADEVRRTIVTGVARA